VTQAVLAHCICFLCSVSSLSQSQITLQQCLLHFGGFSFCALINESFSASKQYQSGKCGAWNLKACLYWHINSGKEPHCCD